MSTTDSVSADAQFWAAIRRDRFLLDPDVVFLQGGSVGPSPRPVVDTVTEGIRSFDSNPLKHQPLFWPIVEEAREKLASFVGTSAERLALVQNTTMAMSVPAQGLTWKEGGEILTTDQEYGAVRACWDYIAERYKMKIVKVKTAVGDRERGTDRGYFQRRLHGPNACGGVRARLLVYRAGHAYQAAHGTGARAGCLGDRRRGARGGHGDA